MKKFLTILGLISVLSIGSAAFAVPPPHAGHYHPQVIHAGHSYHRPPHYGGYGHVPPPPSPRYHGYYGSPVIMSGYWGRGCFRNNYFYDSQMNYYGNYFVRPHLGGGMYIRF